jgi:thiamine biosynthesis lipoprotein
MGTTCALHLYAPDSEAAESAAWAALQEVQRIEARFSRYRADSDLSRLNSVAKSGGAVAIDDEMAGILSYAFSAYARSGGLFDITSGLLRHAWDFRSGRVPAQETLDQLLPRIGLNKVRWNPPVLTFTRPGMELDFGGIGKEYAADRAAAACKADGVSHGVVDLGGDIHVIGPHPDGRPWKIGIRDPNRPGEQMSAALLHRGGLATSGDYERCIQVGGRRYGHILNPVTGWPVHGLCSVSVIADQCLLAGTLCTIAMLKAEQGPEWLRDVGLPHLWMDHHGVRGEELWPTAKALEATAV